jgi:ribosomal protein S15P/S13E
MSFHSTAPALAKMIAQKNTIKLRGGRASAVTQVKRRNMDVLATGELVVMRGTHRVKAAKTLMTQLEEVESPMVWIWYPWRRTPEPPTPSFPCPNALKNLHGAVYSSLSTVQQARQSEFSDGTTVTSIPPTRDERLAQTHPFLSRVLRATSGAAMAKAATSAGKGVAAAIGFPFWFKRYPTRRHAYEHRFSIPKEMLSAYSVDMQRALSQPNFSERELLAAEKAKYVEQYAEHDMDTNSPAVTCVMLALKTRHLRNHLLTNTNNNIAKFALARKERALQLSLRRLRKLDFHRYWQILRDHDVMDLVQPSNVVSYRWGRYWQYDWNQGIGISTNISDFMDPRGMSGCIETGRSRAEVARDLGLSYTRVLTDSERRQLDLRAKYFERLQKYRVEQPEAWRTQQRKEFVRKFTGMFTRLNYKSCAPDFPNRYRNAVGTKMTRWKSARHGPK